MSRSPEDAPSESELRIAASRRRAEERLAEVREAVAEEVGRVPRNATLLLAGVAAAVLGVAVAWRGRRRRARLARHARSSRARDLG